MGKTVFITEKPSVAQDYRKALKVNVSGKHDGYMEGHSDVLNKQVCITWCVGHLCTLSYPEVYNENLKKWSLDTLPFLPAEYKYEVIPDVKKQFAIVKKLYHDADLEAIYYAGDAGREGLYIQMLVRQLAGVKSGITERIVWIDSHTEREILKGIQDAKPLSVYQTRKEAAYMRAIEDYAIGINFSRALSCQYGYDFNKRIGGDKRISIDVGRVMTCVLGMIVEREREIKEFQEIPFYKLEANTGFTSEWKAVEGSAYHESVFLYNESGFKERDKAELLLNTLNNDKHLEVEDAKSSTEKKKAPLLFNLAEIQFFCSKKYKISPDQTLAVIQSLYEKKLVTYPRTDARVLSTAVAGELNINLNGLAKLGYKKDIVMKIAQNGWYKGIEKTHYVDDSKITDHYAIIPTGNYENSGTLTEQELNIYHDIIDRFLCIFYPAAVYQKTEVVLKHVMGERFFTSKKTIQEYGYFEVLDEKPEKESSVIHNIKKGQVLDATYEVKEGKTTPPKRYSSGSMVIAMENAGKMIEDEALREQIKGSGIGTSATRAETIKKLCKKGYISLNSKTQILTPTGIGECVYDIVKDTLPALLKPDITASWEKGLEGIEKGVVTQEQYKQKMEQYVTGEIQNIKDKREINYGVYAQAVKPATSTADLSCPLCGKPLREFKTNFGCSGYKDGCKFSVWKTIAGKTLTAAQVAKLVKDKKTNKIKGFKSKAGKEFEAVLIMDNEGKISFDFGK